jgi:hypothetical protein
MEVKGKKRRSEGNSEKARAATIERSSYNNDEKARCSKYRLLSFSLTLVVSHGIMDGRSKRKMKSEDKRKKQQQNKNMKR